MRNVFEYYDEKDHLEHHGIKGQKWGVRRFQNSDGTLTESGRRRYAKKFIKADKTIKDVYGGRSSFHLSERDKEKLNKISIESFKDRQKIYESSKECKVILDKVRVLRDEFLIAKDKKKQDELFNELCDYQYFFRKAATLAYSDLFKSIGSNVKTADGKYDLKDVLGDKAYYDDFWSYVFKEVD